MRFFSGTSPRVPKLSLQLAPGSHSFVRAKVLARFHICFYTAPGLSRTF